MLFKSLEAFLFSSLKLDVGKRMSWDIKEQQVSCSPMFLCGPVANLVPGATELGPCSGLVGAVSCWDTLRL